MCFVLLALHLGLSESFEFARLQISIFDFVFYSKAPPAHSAGPIFGMVLGRFWAGFGKLFASFLGVPGIGCSSNL